MNFSTDITNCSEFLDLLIRIRNYHRPYVYYSIIRNIITEGALQLTVDDQNDIVPTSDDGDYWYDIYRHHLLKLNHFDFAIKRHGPHKIITKYPQGLIDIYDKLVTIIASTSDWSDKLNLWKFEQMVMWIVVGDYIRKNNVYLMASEFRSFVYLKDFLVIVVELRKIGVSPEDFYTTTTNEITYLEQSTTNDNRISFNGIGFHILYSLISLKRSYINTFLEKTINYPTSIKSSFFLCLLTDGIITLATINEIVQTMSTDHGPRFHNNILDGEFEFIFTPIHVLEMSGREPSLYVTWVQEYKREAWRVFIKWSSDYSYIEFDRCFVTSVALTKQYQTQLMDKYKILLENRTFCSKVQAFNGIFYLTKRGNLYLYDLTSFNNNDLTKIPLVEKSTFFDILHNLPVQNIFTVLSIYYISNFKPSCENGLAIIRKNQISNYNFSVIDYTKLPIVDDLWIQPTWIVRQTNGFYIVVDNTIGFCSELLDVNVVSVIIKASNVHFKSGIKNFLVNITITKRLTENDVQKNINRFKNSLSFLSTHII